MDSPNPDPPAVYSFSGFRLSAHVLERDGRRIALSPKALDTLRILVEASGQVVDKNELMDRVWPDAHVVESGLARNISVLRKTLEDHGGSASWIETIPRRGYRFTESVELGASEPSVEPAAAPRRWAPLVLAATLLFAAGGAFLYFNRPAPPPPPPAQEFLVGRHLLQKRNPEDTRRSLHAFERAVAANPDSAEAHAGVADALLALISMAAAPIEAGPEAVEAAERAVQLDPESAAAHATLGALQLAVLWDPDAAEVSLSRSLEIDSESVIALFYESRRLSGARRFDQALDVLARAQKLDPISPLIAVQVGYNHYAQRDFPRAAEIFQDVLARERNDAHANYYYALTLAYLDRFDEALEQLHAAELHPEVLATDAAWIRARQGDLAPMQQRWDEFQQGIAEGRLNADVLLIPAAALGRIDEGIRALEEAFADRHVGILHLASDPRIEPLRRDPRFRALFELHGLKVDW